MESKSPPRPFLTGCSCGAHGSWQHGSPLPLHTLVHAEALLALSAWDSLSSVLVTTTPGSQLELLPLPTEENASEPQKAQGTT